MGLCVQLVVAGVLLLLLGASAAGLWTLLLLSVQLRSSFQEKAAASTSGGSLPECRLRWT
jgi:hypothetical protein